jgi:hypothetical protein
MYKITKYRNAQSSIIQDTLMIEEVFEIIEKGDSKLNHIKHARSFEKGSTDYDEVRKFLIPTFRFNFLFKDKAANNNITKPTGLIYIDADLIDTIPQSDFIFAKWKSLSLTGYCILVKVQNLSFDNFKDYYNKISSILNINSDAGARKATQQTIQSYDPDIYINYNSKIYKHPKIEKVSSPIKQKKGGECLTRDDTLLSTPRNVKFRYDNIDDYFIDNDYQYIVFSGDKEKICDPYIPKRVEKGNRNQYLFIYLSQILALNPNMNKPYLIAMADNINLNVMKPKLVDNEILKIVNSLFKMKGSNELKIYLNKERRIIFNPKLRMSFQDKMKIVNKELGSIASEKTTQKIYECIEMWDFQFEGKITQRKVADLTELHLSTIKRYWHNFKSYVKDLNYGYKLENGHQKSISANCALDISYILEPLLKKAA